MSDPYTHTAGYIARRERPAVITVMLAAFMFRVVLYLGGLPLRDADSIGAQQLGSVLAPTANQLRGLFSVEVFTRLELSLLVQILLPVAWLAGAMVAGRYRRLTGIVTYAFATSLMFWLLCMSIDVSWALDTAWSTGEGVTRFAGLANS